MSPRTHDDTDGATDDRSEAYDAMAHQHRRWAIRAVESCGTLDLRTIAAHVLRREGATGESSRREVTIGLYHVHLPKLDDAGFVEFDPDDQTVAPGSRITTSDARFDSVGVATSD